MWPCLFVSVDLATALVASMWWKSRLGPDVFLPADAYLGMFDSESDSAGYLGHSDSDAELVEVT
jgi:hypothetical protein